MKIIKLTYQEILPVSTTVIKNKNNKYHNLKHGTRGPGLWEWTASMNVINYPVKEDKPIVLDKDNYTLIPVTKNKSTVTDSKGNILYSISADDITSHKKDILLLWELPIKNFKEIVYIVSGDILELGVGYIGKTRGDRKQKIPAPVLEITGDCVLMWVGGTFDNKKYSQTVNFTYNNSSWDINPPKLLEG